MFRSLQTTTGRPRPSCASRPQRSPLARSTRCGITSTPSIASRARSAPATRRTPFSSISHARCQVLTFRAGRRIAPGVVSRPSRARLEGRRTAWAGLHPDADLQGTGRREGRGWVRTVRVSRRADPGGLGTSSIGRWPLARRVGGSVRVPTVSSPLKSRQFRRLKTRPLKRRRRGVYGRDKATCSRRSSDSLVPASIPELR